MRNRLAAIAMATTAFAFPIHAEETAASKIVSEVDKKHHFAMLDDGLLTAQINWISAIGMRMFVNNHCGEDIVPKSLINRQRQEAIESFNIPADKMERGSVAFAADLDAAFAAASPDVLSQYCESLKQN